MSRVHDIDATLARIPGGRMRRARVGLAAALALLCASLASCTGDSPGDGKAIEYQPAPSASAAPEASADTGGAAGRTAESAAPKPAPATASPAETAPAAEPVKGPAAESGVEPAPKTAEPRDAPPPLDDRGPVGLSKFVLVEPGTFQMGYADAGVVQQPVHRVTISRAFYIQKTEVTQGQWRAVMGTNPSSNSACGDDCPVEQVSWHDAQRFIEALNDMVPDARYRLPTEAEWEYAARASMAGRLLQASELDGAGWFEGNAGGRSHPTARKQPNTRGLFDVYGNVAEWVADPYLAEYYRLSPELDPPGPRNGANRVVRGGSWGSAARFAGALGRVDKDPFTRDFSIGFRLVRDP